MKREWRVLPDDEAATFVHVRNPTCEVRGCLPVVVIDPGPGGAPAKALIEALRTAAENDVAVAKPLRWLADQIAEQTAQKPDEPTDPAARVKDKDGDNWARIERVDGAFWVNALGGKPYKWGALVDEFGPIEVTS